MQDNFRALGADSSPLSLQPADRVKRLLAHIIDGLVVLVPMFIGMPFLIFAGASGDGDGPPILMLLVMGILALVVLALVVYQMVLLASTGQTIGKRAQKIRIVSIDGTRADWIKTILMRMFVTNIASQFTMGILGLLDPFFIFRDDNRCIHDHIAGTIVVDAE